MKKRISILKLKIYKLFLNNKIINKNKSFYLYVFKLILKYNYLINSF